MIEHLPECPKSGCPACYEQGQRDALAAAVQRVVNDSRFARFGHATEGQQ